MSNSMLLAIDGRPANETRRVGIGNYCFEVVRALAALPGAPRLRIYLDAPPVPGFPVDGGNADIRVLPACRGWTHRAMGSDLRRDPADVFFSAGLQIPAFCSVPRVATVHDLAYITFPEHFTAVNRVANRVYARYALGRAAHLIAVSEATKQDAMRLFGVPESRITVALEGASAQYHGAIPQADQNRVRDKLGLHAPYVLYVGALQPRKNLARLMEAFATVIARRPDLPHELVIAGGKGWLYDSIFAAAEASPAKARIRFLDYVPGGDLPALMAGADVLALVSLWEGFGLPVLEAMACGTAVLTSNCSSLPEVAGDAGVLVDPYDVAAIAAGLESLMSDESRRKACVERGFQRAQEFTWEKTAQSVLGAVRSLV
ncbi:MAG: glycosyltransferase family 4 protein [Candidatus Hydrogenedentes bacterium]|nr:glycosyltransferase family 4 protein [Candidatus Hydrogenedentota bacterium]